MVFIGQMVTDGIAKGTIILYVYSAIYNNAYHLHIFGNIIKTGSTWRHEAIGQVLNSSCSLVHTALWYATL